MVNPHRRNLRLLGPLIVLVIIIFVATLSYLFVILPTSLCRQQEHQPHGKEESLSMLCEAVAKTSSRNDTAASPISDVAVFSIATQQEDKQRQYSNNRMEVINAKESNVATRTGTNGTATTVNMYIISMREQRLHEITKRLNSILLPGGYVMNMIHFQGINGSVAMKEGQTTTAKPSRSNSHPQPYQDWIHYPCPFRGKSVYKNESSWCQYYERNVTSGEFGCSLSHVNVIKHIYSKQQRQRNRNDMHTWNIIVEDDVYFNTHILYKIQSLFHELPSSSSSSTEIQKQSTTTTPTTPNDWDMLYLARQQVLLDTTQPYSSNLVRPGRSWGGWAIMYSTQGIQKLVTTKFAKFEQNIIVWDEYLPAIQRNYDSPTIMNLYMNTTSQLGVGDDEPLYAYALKKDLAWTIVDDNTIHDTEMT